MGTTYSINVTDYFQAADPDYTQAFVRAILAGQNILVPPGTYAISGPLVIPDNTKITGAGTGNTIIEVPEDINGHMVYGIDSVNGQLTDGKFVGMSVFNIFSVSNVRIAHLTLRKAWTKPYDPNVVTTGVTGIQIGGNSKDIYVDDVIADGFYRGFEIYNSGNPFFPVTENGSAIFHETMPENHAGTNTVDAYENSYNDYPLARRITFSDCKATISASFAPHQFNGQFGFHLCDCNTVTLLNCHAERQYLDGIKIPKNTRNVSIIGGSSRFNGRANFTAKLIPPAKHIGSIVGDGLDCFAGGDTLTIRDTVFEYNTGNGITVKTGYLNSTQLLPGGGVQSFNEYYGNVGNVQIIGVKSSFNNGYGIVFYQDREPVDKVLTSSIPFPIGLTVAGGVFNYNNEAGLLLGAGQHISVTGSLIGYNKGTTDPYKCCGIQLGLDDNLGATKQIYPGSVILQGVHIFVNADTNSTPLTGIKILGANRLLIQGCVVDGNTNYPDGNAPDNEQFIETAIMHLGTPQHYTADNVFIVNCINSNT